MEYDFSLKSIDLQFLRRWQFELTAEMNISKIAEYHNVKVAALSLINERRFYELELTVSGLIQSDCFNNTRLHCHYMGTYTGN
jgi:hypothetical protein